MGVVGVLRRGSSWSRTSKKVYFNAKSCVLVHSWFRNGQMLTGGDPEDTARGKGWAGNG